MLVLFGGLSYAETEPNNDCSEANPILAFGVYTGSDIGSSSGGDQDYFYFDVAANGTLQVTINNLTNKTLNYASLTTPFCPSSISGSIGNNASTVLTISSTLAGRYFIYVEGDNKNVANSYEISAQFTPNTPSSGHDLKITKVASVEEALIYDPFYYTLSVSNIGDQNVTEVNLTDTLPLGMTADLDTTNSLTSEWGCMDESGHTTGERSGVITCTLTDQLNTGDVSIFRLYVRAPSTPGDISNTIEINSTVPDIDPTNNVDTETTTITNEVDTAEHLCYTERTEVLNADYNATCDIKGNFYYGNGCEAYVLVREYNATTILSDIKVYKMYAPELKGGTCEYSASSSGGTSSDQCNDITNTTEYGSYTQGYAVDIDQNLVNHVELLLHDSNSYNTPRIDGIAMFGDYITELGFHHTGRIYECNGTSEGGVTVTSSADLIDTPIDSNNAPTYNAHAADVEGSLKYIQTMVAGTPSREITGVHLNLAGEAVPYATLTGIPYSIVPYMSDNTCATNEDNIINPVTGEQLVIDVPNGEISATGPMIVPPNVSQASRMQLIFIDANTLSVEGQNCLANSSTTGNFARLAQCVNSEVQYKTAFGQDAWDRCGNNSGRPCLSQNNGYADPTDPSYDPATDSIYVNELGCYMCTFNIQPACTTDNFAVRPDRLESGISHADAPDLLRAGKEYLLSLTARYPTDGIYPNGSAIPADAVVPDYTVNDHNYNSDLNSSVIRYFKNGQPDTEGVLVGTSEVNTSRTGFMVGGLSSENLLGPASPGTADETVGIHYTDVGTIELNIYDKEWAVVDNDDTPMDCNSSAHTYICTHDTVTFIPHHFSIENIILRNHRDGNSTYLSTDLNMSAHVDTTIVARNAQGGITQNFREGALFYENPVSVDLNVTDWNLSATNRHPLGNTVNVHDIPTEMLLGFGGEEANGTHTIAWNDDNLSHRLMFNYQRYNNQPVNPFNVPERDINISAASTYTGITNTQAIITGSGIETDDRNATFLFGRTKASKEFYEDITGNSVNTPVAIYVYCNTQERSYAWCSSHHVDILFGQTSIPHWWISTGHNSSLDGSVTLTSVPYADTIKEGNGAPRLENTGSGEVTTLLINAQQGIDNNITVIGHTSQRPMTVWINLDTSTNLDTAPWLIYNQKHESNPPLPFYKVRFINASGWTGVGKTGFILETNASSTKNKRLDW
ncbi:MAG: hypothetical protein ABXS91_00010 [Sulfurimonas sp.]